MLNKNTKKTRILNVITNICIAFFSNSSEKIHRKPWISLQICLHWFTKILMFMAASGKLKDGDSLQISCFEFCSSCYFTNIIHVHSIYFKLFFSLCSFLHFTIISYTHSVRCFVLVMIQQVKILTMLNSWLSKLVIIGIPFINNKIYTFQHVTLVNFSLIFMTEWTTYI